MLQAALEVHVAGVVTLTLEVRNDGAAETVDFATGQQYELEIHAEPGPLLWRWSADRMFAQAMCSRTLGAGERWTFVERWQPTAHGRLRAVATLTSASHGTETSIRFNVP